MTEGRSVSIVVPTYREAANIQAPAERVPAALCGPGIERGPVLAGGDFSNGRGAMAAEPAHCLRIRSESGREAVPDLQQPVGFRIALDFMVRGRLRVRKVPG